MTVDRRANESRDAGENDTHALWSGASMNQPDSGYQSRENEKETREHPAASKSKGMSLAKQIELVVIFLLRFDPFSPVVLFGMKRL
jgi:hypothetical protein